MKKAVSLILTAVLMLGMALPSCAAAEPLANTDITSIVLSDSGVTVDGSSAGTDPESAVYVGATPIYYEAGHDSTYGEGGSEDEHTAEEAEAHTVVTITQPGTYRISGKLSLGQIFVDLGEDAENDPNAVVTLMLDGVDITCTVAPAVFFYRVYECSDSSVDTNGVVDTSAAGANVVICDGSTNTVSGSYVARIYKEGTTKKLHKYDGAFYSKMSMNINGGTKGDGVLNIVAENEGLDSELHLTINGGNISIQSQDDGINTNEDFISVTTINGGTLYVNAGLGSEGDGIDSNGYLTVNGGSVYTMANPGTPDGGIDADSPIAINGGSVIAMGMRNDAASGDSEQPYLELSFASRRAAGSVVSLTDSEGSEIMSFTADKAFSSLTLSCPELKLGETYHLYVDGVQQQYSSAGANMGFGGFGGGRGDFDPSDLPEGFDPTQRGERPEGMQRPEGEQPADMPTPPDGSEGMTPPEGVPDKPEGAEPPDGAQVLPEGIEPPAVGEPPEGFGGGRGEFEQQTVGGEGSVDFKLEKGAMSFGGVTDSTASGKTGVSFRVEADLSVASGGQPTITSITPSVELDGANVVVTITDDPSENFAASVTMAEGLDAVNAALPTDDGDYILTVAVVSTNETYTGATQLRFSIGAMPFVDVRRTDPSYDAIKTLYDMGVMKGTSDTTFEPNATLDRAQAVTMLARIAGAEYADSCGFEDVVDDGWSYGYIGWASENGIVIGYGDGRFGQYDALTEIQLEIMLARLGGDAEPEYDAARDVPITRAQAAEMIAGYLANK